MGKRLAITGMVFGIVSLVLCWFGPLAFVTLVLSIVGLILAILGGKKLKANGQKSGIVTAGLVLSILAIVFSGIIVVACGLCLATVESAAEAAKANQELVKVVSSLMK
jgi:hypothetical protein